MDSDNTTQIIVAALSSGFLTWVIPALGKRFRSWRAGAEKRKRTDLDRMADQIVAAEQDKAAALAEKRAAEEAANAADAARLRALARADAEAAKRRALAESLSQHRRIIIEAPCLSDRDLPAYPT